MQLEAHVLTKLMKFGETDDRLQNTVCIPHCVHKVIKSLISWLTIHYDVELPILLFMNSFKSDKSPGPLCSSLCATMLQLHYWQNNSIPCITCQQLRMMCFATAKNRWDCNKRMWLKSVTSTSSSSGGFKLRGGNQGTCLAPSHTFQGPSLWYFAHKFLSLLVNNLSTHIIYFEADHK